MIGETSPLHSLVVGTLFTGFRADALPCTIGVRRNRWDNCAVQQRFLTSDEIKDARATVGWQFWAAPIMFGTGCLGLGIGALGGDPLITFLFFFFLIPAFVLCIVRFRDYQKVVHDIELRIVDVIEGAPERVWATKGGFCYLRLAGHTIRVPNDSYGELREANMVRVAFLPTALAAVRVEPFRGIAGL